MPYILEILDKLGQRTESIRKMDTLKMLMHLYFAVMGFIIDLKKKKEEWIVTDTRYRIKQIEQYF